MKKITTLLVATTLALSLAAQETQYLPISVYVESQAEQCPPAAQVQIKNKLTQLLTANGIASMNYFGQFFLTAFVVPQTKEVLSTAPTKIVEQMEVTFYIADYANQVIFSTASLPAKGVGDTETKCYMNAVKSINTASPVLAEFIQEGKTKIIDYYNHEADNIIKKANFLASTKQYEEALSLIVTVPAQCNKYDQALQTGLDIYQQYIDYQCNINLSAARQAWAAEQNTIGATKAGEYLALILPDAGCYDDAMKLYTEIKAKVLDDWKFEMKKYQDGIDLAKQRISAMRDVGVAYGRGQQPTTTNIGFLR